MKSPDQSWPRRKFMNVNDHGLTPGVAPVARPVWVVVVPPYEGHDRRERTHWDEPLVEFYDGRFADDPRYHLHPGLGQFMSRYYAETLLTRGSGGLCLDGSVREWDISTQTMGEIVEWLDAVIADANTSSRFDVVDDDDGEDPFTDGPEDEEQ